MNIEVHTSLSHKPLKHLIVQIIRRKGLNLPFLPNLLTIIERKNLRNVPNHLPIQVQHQNTHLNNFPQPDFGRLEKLELLKVRDKLLNLLKHHHENIVAEVVAVKHVDVVAAFGNYEVVHFLEGLVGRGCLVLELLE